MSYADLRGAGLSNAILTGANLIGADMSPVPVITRSGERKEVTNLDGADLSGVHNLTQAQLDQACGKPKALPPGAEPGQAVPALNLAYPPTYHNVRRATYPFQAALSHDITPSSTPP